MTEPSARKPSQRFAQTVVEENAAPSHKDGLATTTAVPRKPTPVGMPAPPVNRQSHDDLDHVLQIEKLERERAQLLAHLQDTKGELREAKTALLREKAPTAIFPPPSIPPPPNKKPDLKPDPPPAPAPVGHQLRAFATAAGIAFAIGWNAFNSYRSAPEKVEAVQARVTQNEQTKSEDVKLQVLKDQRTMQALRALHCWGQQTRGAFARQGVDLSSLPPGGITVKRLDQGEPGKPPAFLVDEKCPDFPQLPPDTAPP